MENKRMTKRDYFSKLIEVIEGADVENRTELVDFLNHQIELLNKKSTGNSKADKEKAETMELIYNALAEMDHPVTVTEFQTLTDNEVIKEMSNQKISSNFTKLKGLNRIVKTEDKRKSYFSVIAE